MSLKAKITEYLRQEYPRVVHKGEMGKLAILEWGYENENMGRRCRELENEGVIEKIPNAKGEAQYRYKKEVSEKVKQIISLLEKPKAEQSEKVQGAML